MSKLKKTCVCLFIVLAFIAISPHLSAVYNTRDKLELQKSTQECLEKLEELSYPVQRFNALFTSNEAKVIDLYKNRFHALNEILNQLTQLRDDWGQKIKESKNDLVYRLYLATTQTALYSIYSRPEKYIGFLKYDDNSLTQNSTQTQTEKTEAATESTNLQMEITGEASVSMNKTQNPSTQSLNASGAVGVTSSVEKKGKASPRKLSEIELPTYEENAKDWEIKAEIMKNQAYFNLDEALKLDEHSEDAQILKAQLLALDGEFDKSLDILSQLEQKSVFKEKPAILDSWKAYFFIKNGDLQKGMKLLRIASTNSIPYNYSKWAGSYLKSLLLTSWNWVEYDFIDFNTIDDITIDKLKNESSDILKSINNGLNSPIVGVNLSYNRDNTVKISKSKSAKIFWTIESDKSKENINQIATLIDNLYHSGVELEKLIGYWNQLVLNNSNVAYYYLLQKSYCTFALINLAEKTKSLLQNERLLNALKEKHATVKDEEKIDYKLKCKKWSQEYKILLERDIKDILSQKPDFIFANLLDFEFHALLDSPQDALIKLDIISNELKNRHIKTLTIFPETATVDSSSYLNAWKAFLALKEGKISMAKEYMQKLGYKFQNWEEFQVKTVRIKNIPTVDTQTTN